jgi:hypothetical protein
MKNAFPVLDRSLYCYDLFQLSDYLPTNDDLTVKTVDEIRDSILKEGYKNWLEIDVDENSLPLPQRLVIWAYVSRSISFSIMQESFNANNTEDSSKLFHAALWHRDYSCRILKDFEALRDYGFELKNTIAKADGYTKAYLSGIDAANKRRLTEQQKRNDAILFEEFISNRLHEIVKNGRTISKDQVIQECCKQFDVSRATVFSRLKILK